MVSIPHTGVERKAQAGTGSCFILQTSETVRLTHGLVLESKHILEILIYRKACVIVGRSPVVPQSRGCLHTDEASNGATHKWCLLFIPGEVGNSFTPFGQVTRTHEWIPPNTGTQSIIRVDTIEHVPIPRLSNV
jgi:hypothetical protein